MDKKATKQSIEASEEELLFIKKNMPKGMVKMVMIRTGKTRSQVLYQLIQMPNNQDLDIITAFREILFAITQLRFESKE
ncbi:hypothetical protein [Flavobacterium daejeonense]|uniref:hypothetical protein n=1 Tax=Flavobacterium daejeonense TaxID=350893 RepID=UPI00047D449F|nr:hypothetical protein [Flavobacterium daejeonense]